MPPYPFLWILKFFWQFSFLVGQLFLQTLNLLQLFLHLDQLVVCGVPQHGCPRHRHCMRIFKREMTQIYLLRFYWCTQSLNIPNSSEDCNLRGNFSFCLSVLTRVSHSGFSNVRFIYSALNCYGIHYHQSKTTKTQ